MTRKNNFKLLEKVSDAVEEKERKPFIISTPITTAIGDPLSHVLDGFAADELLDPVRYDKNSKNEIHLNNPGEYQEAIIAACGKIAEENPDMSCLEGYSMAKDELENSYFLMNTNSPQPVKINNFHDAAMLPNLATIMNYYEIENHKFFDKHAEKDAIFNLIKFKISSICRNIMTSFVISYNNDITRVVMNYITQSPEELKIDPNLITITPDSSSFDGFSLAPMCVNALYDVFGRILYNDSIETFKDNMPTYYLQGETLIDQILLKIYDTVEDNVLNNFIAYMNKNIATIDMSAVKDIQLLLIDRLAPNILMLRPDFLQMFNNILTDIEMFYLRAVDNSGKRRPSNDYDEDDYADYNSGIGTYDRYFRNSIHR